MASRRCGYRIWAEGDRCVADWNLRQARKTLARYRAREGARPDVLAQLEEWEQRMEGAVRAWEARYQLGEAAR